jgi:hypothetical protein
MIFTLGPNIFTSGPETFLLGLVIYTMGLIGFYKGYFKNKTERPTAVCTNGVARDLSECGSDYLFSFNCVFSFKVFGIFVFVSVENRHWRKRQNVSEKHSFAFQKINFIDFFHLTPTLFFFRNLTELCLNILRRNLSWNI